MADLVTNGVGDWDWDNKSVAVQNNTAAADKGLSPADFIEGGTTLILSGPRLVSQLTGGAASLVPIGMLDNVSVSQQKNIQQIFEIGSKLAHIVPGRTMGQMQLGRVFFDGDSLLKAMYAGSGYKFDAATKTASSEFDTGVTSNQNFENSVAEVNSGKFAANLASSYFDLPHGLCFMFKDQSGGEVATIYFEDCMINSHQFSINAQANIIQEGASLMFRRIVPVEVSAVTSTMGDYEIPKI